MIPNTKVHYGCFPQEDNLKMYKELLSSLEKKINFSQESNKLSYEEIFEKAVHNTIEELKLESAAFYLKICSKEKIDLYLSTIGKVDFYYKVTQNVDSFMGKVRNFPTIREYFLKKTAPHDLKIEKKSHQLHEIFFISRESMYK